MIKDEEGIIAIIYIFCCIVLFCSIVSMCNGIKNIDNKIDAINNNLEKIIKGIGEKK